MRPPTPASAEPTETVMLPALPPPTALPVLICNKPELPELVVPVENFKDPLTPATPALAVWNTTAPLDVAVPVPLFNETAPPVANALIPLVM